MIVDRSLSANTKLNKVAVVIPVFNRKKYLKDCLISLEKQTIKFFKIVVVDDGSSDGTGEMVRSEFPDVILLHGDGNLWWTGATNLGVEYSLANGADFILTLNDDTFAAEDFLEKMLAWAERMPGALLGALAINAESREIAYGGERINWLTGRYLPVLDHLQPEQRSGLQEVTHFPGRGLLIPANVFRKIGLYDRKHFPHYIADYDFTHRAVKAGYQVFCNYDAVLYIYPEASGSVELRKKRSLPNYLRHLSGMKGGANLKVFTWYAIKNCPRKYFPFFLIQGYIRRLLGYWIK